MQITRIPTRQVDIPLPAPFYPAWAPGRVETQIRVAYVRIDTDAGVYGIAGHEFYGAEEQAVARIATYLAGEDPLRIEKHTGTLRYLWPYFGTAVWFVELALWDILGKIAGLPVYKLLGNVSDAVPVYASTGQNRTPAQRAYAELQRLHAASPVAIAGGEVNQRFDELQRLLLDGCYDILQPDVTLCEGLLRTKALATMAHAAGVLLTPHTWGDPLGMVANLHLAASISNTTFFEFPHDPPAFPSSTYQQTLREPLAVADGMVRLPQAPGMGVELQDWIFG